MKKSILLVLVAAGLAFGAKGQTEYLVTVDPATGAFTKVNSIPGVAWIQASPDCNTLDETNNSYIFVGEPPPNTPHYLYSINNSNGDIISDPLFSGDLQWMLYGDSLKIFYGIEDLNGVWSLVSVNSMTGTYTTINTLNNGFDGVWQITYNHNLNELIILAEDTSRNTDFFILDGKTGDIISKILTSYYSEIHFDNTTNQLFGVQTTDSSGTQLYHFGKIDIATGIFSIIYNFPSDGYVEGYSTFDEKDQEYIVVAGEQNVEQWYLYFINVATGNIVYKDNVDWGNGLDADDVIEYKYDNTTNILYALHWEYLTMPVTLLSFTAAKQANQNLLHWSTTQEISSSYFGVERSGDGINFTTIGQVNAAGNSIATHNYTFTDNLSSVNDHPSSLFYRLKMVDKDGKFTYGPIRSINETANFAASIYPNPVQNNLSLNCSSGKAMAVQVEIINNEGKIITTQQMQVAAGVTTQSINTASLSNGAYYVRLISAEGKTELKFVK